jgi:hypothetical protein
MTVTRQSLSEYYESLNDEALRDLFHSGELTALAQEVAGTELQRRGISIQSALTPTKEPPRDEEAAKELDERGEGKLVLLAQLWTAAEAEMLRGRLNAEGVDAIIADAQVVQTTAMMSLAFGGVRVLVPESQLERARDIVKAVEAGYRRR